MTIVIAIGGVAEVMAILLSIVAVSTTSAVTDNKNSADASVNDSSSTVAANRSLDNSESAKSGINTLATGKMMLLSRLFCCSKD
jgi:hypothetical protein